MLKVSQKLSELGVLDIFPMNQHYKNGAARANDSGEYITPEGTVWKDLGYTVVSIEIDEFTVCDTGIKSPVTEEKIIEAIYRLKSMYISRNTPYMIIDRALIPELRTLPSGTISMSQINDEFQRPSTQTISLNDADVRTLAGRPSGTISLSDLRGKSRDFWVQSTAERWVQAEITWWIPSNIQYNNATIQYVNGAAIHSNANNVHALHVRNTLTNNVILEFLPGSRCIGSGGPGGAGGTQGGGGGGGGGGAAIYRGQTLTMSIHAGATLGGGGGGGGGGGAFYYSGGTKGTNPYWLGGSGGGGGYGGGSGYGGAAGGVSGIANMQIWPANGGASGDTWAGAGGPQSQGYGQVTKAGATTYYGGAGGNGGGLGGAGGNGGGGWASSGGAGGYGGGAGGPGAGGGWSLSPNALYEAYKNHPGEINHRGSRFKINITETEIAQVKEHDVAVVYENDSGDRIVLFRDGAAGMPGELITHGVNDNNFKLIHIK